MDKVMFSSKSIEWATPPDLFKMLDDEHHFTLDVCAREWNKKVDRFFSPEDNGLVQSWAGHTCWMNPPYGRFMGKWIEKAAHEAKHAKIVALLPARTDTQYFHKWIKPNGHNITFIEGRVAFLREGQDTVARAPFPSMVVIFDARSEASQGNANESDPSSHGLANAG